MGDTKTTLTWLLRDQVSGPAKGVKGALDDTGAAATKNAGLMGKLSSATGGLVSPLSLALGGVTALVGGLGFAAKAAADEEKNIALMTTALKASVPGFDGNTAAIEDLIAKREDLAFSDDDLRASLATLVTSTHDVAAAQDLQSTAMDLARLKNVDLQTASEALAKANNGSTKELKALGISVDDAKDKTQVLAAIQKAAAGQAAAYAETAGGKWETLQNKFGDIVETIGGAVLPIFDALASFAIDTLIPTIGTFANIVGPVLGGAFSFMGKAIGFAIDNFVKPAIEIVRRLIGWVQDAIDWLKSLNLVQEHTAAESIAYHTTGVVPHASGGILSPGWNLVGEQGPELISPQRMVIPLQQGAGAGGTPVEIPIVLDGREIARVVDRHLFYTQQRAAPTIGRV